MNYTNPHIARDDHIKSLALTVARNRVGPRDPIEEVLAAECVAPEEFERLTDDPVFKRYVNDYVRELEDSGFSVQSKARVLFEDALGSFYRMIIDEDTPAMARAKGMEHLAEWSGIAAKAKELAAPAGGTGFHITFNIPSLPDAHQGSITIEQTAAPTVALKFDKDAADYAEEDEDSGAYD